jgi:hypothetical protein
MVTNLLQVLSEVEVLVEESIDERSAGFTVPVRELITNAN